MSEKRQAEKKPSACEQEIAELEKYRLRRAREDVLAFAKYCIPGFEISWHHRVIAKYLTRMAKGEVTRLLVTVPPGHGKSTLCSIAFPAFVLGYNRNNKVLTASYNQSLSTKFSRQVQRLMDSEEYKRVFPETRLPEGERVRGKTSYMRTQAEFEIQNALGFYKASSVGGTATGVRLTCFAAGTAVATEQGPIAIEKFVDMGSPPRVWAYCEATGKNKLCRVNAVRQSAAASLVSLTFASGHAFTCTPEHLVRTPEGHWRQAASLRAGSAACVRTGQAWQKTVVVSALQQAVRKETSAAFEVRKIFASQRMRIAMPVVQEKIAAAHIRLPQGLKKQLAGILRQKVQNACSQYNLAHKFVSPMHWLSQTSAAIFAQWKNNLSTCLSAVQNFSRSTATCAMANKATLCFLQEDICCGDKDAEALHCRLQQQNAFGAYERQSQSLVSPRARGRETKTVQSHVSHLSKICSIARQAYMFFVRQKTKGTAGACASHRLQSKKQQTEQPNIAVRQLSPVRAQEANVKGKAVKNAGSVGQCVYDLDVAECHNFYANEILAHNCAIVDDPVKSRQDANSITYRENTWDWYTSTLLTRLDKGGSVLVVLTRWHEDDLGGRIITAGQEDVNAEQYTVVELPAICEEEGAVDDPRKEGEALWPSRFPAEKLKRTRATIGERDFVSLYQQQPRPSEGAVLKADWFKYYDILPEEFEQICIAADLGFKSDEARGDFSVFQVWGVSMGKFYLIDQVRDRMSWVRQKRVMQRLASSYSYTAIYVEAAANGEALVSEVRQLGLTGVLPITPKGSKFTRLEAISATVEAGDVFLPNPKMAGYQWVEQKLVPELLSFPSGKHDDQVDAFSMAISEMRKRAFSFDISGGLAVDKSEDVPLDFLNLYLS